MINLTTKRRLFSIEVWKKGLYRRYEFSSLWFYNANPNPSFGTIRTLLISGDPWFVGKDVAEVLGYTNPQKAIRDFVEGDDKGVNKAFTPGGPQEVVIINEYGLDSLILSSKLPTAKAFKIMLMGMIKGSPFWWHLEAPSKQNRCCSHR